MQILDFQTNYTFLKVYFQTAATPSKIASQDLKVYTGLKMSINQQKHADFNLKNI